MRPLADVEDAWGNPGPGWADADIAILVGDTFTLQLMFPMAPDIAQISATQVPGYTVTAPLYTVNAGDSSLVYMPLTATAQQSVEQATATITTTAAQVGAAAVRVVETPGKALSAGAKAAGDALQGAAKAAAGPAVAILAAVAVVALVVLRR